MYITITDDENKYYRTWTSGQTNITGCKCIQCDVLPDISNEKKQFCKLKETIETSYEIINQPLLNENGEVQYTEPELDEEGNIIKPSEIITEEKQIPHNKTIYSWEFDEETYKKHLEEKENKEVEPSEIESLRTDIDLITGCIMDICNTLYSESDSDQTK